MAADGTRNMTQSSTTIQELLDKVEALPSADEIATMQSTIEDLQQAVEELQGNSN